MRMAWVQPESEFAKGQLTRPEDKIAAIFGVVAVMGKKVGSPYIAGLWTDLLPEQTLWRVEVSAEKLKARPLVYQAPTWSWAAVNNPVREIFAFGTFRQSSYFLISHVAIEAETHDMVIDQGPARLRLRGRLLDASLMNRDTLHDSNGHLFHLQTLEFNGVDITISRLSILCRPFCLLTRSLPRQMVLIITRS